MTLAGAETWPAPDRPAGGGLALALCTAALLHLALLAMVFWQPADGGAQAPGQGGLAVSLGPAGAAPGTVATLPAAPVKTEAEPARLPEATAEVPPPAVPVVPAAPVAARALPAETLPTESAPPRAAPAAAALPRLATGPAPEVAQAVGPPAAQDAKTPGPTAAPRPVSAAATPVRQARPVEAAAPEVPPAERLAARDVAPVAPRESPVPRARPAGPPPAAAAGAGGRGGAGKAHSIGSGDASTGGGDPGARADFAARVAAWLARHKAYPRAAQRRRIEGAGVLWFRMDASGRVTAYRITRSAGHPMLDAAIEDTLHRAQPLPRIPPGLGKTTLEFSVPVRFDLR